MTLSMLDSIYPQNLPAGADAYLAYVNGDWVTYPQIVAKFTGAEILSMTVTPGVAADGADCESGDLTVAQLVQWLAWRLAAGAWRPVGYADAGDMQAVVDGLAAAGIARSQVRLLSAHYSAGEHICGPSICGYPAVDGTQWTDKAPGLDGSLIDQSALLPGFFTPPPPQPLPPSGEDMIYLPQGAGATACYPVPTYIPGSGGLPPTVMRFASNSPASLEYNTGDSGNWVPVQFDFSSSPATVSVAGVAAIKVRRVDAGTSPVTADFA